VDDPFRSATAEDHRGLAPLFDTEHAIWRAREQTTWLPRTADFGAYIEPWISEVRDAGLRVRGVLGYRRSAIFAVVIAEGAAAWQEGSPEVVLLDQEGVDGPGPRAVGLYTALRRMGGAGTFDQIGTAAGMIGEVLNLAASRLTPVPGWSAPR